MINQVQMMTSSNSIGSHDSHELPKFGSIAISPKATYDAKASSSDVRVPRDDVSKNPTSKTDVH